MTRPDLSPIELPPPSYSELDEGDAPSSPLSGAISAASSAAASSASSASSTASRSRSSSVSVEDDGLTGGDKPPGYTAAVTMCGELSIKQELVTPFRRSARRPWRAAELEIDNTQLRIKTMFGGVFTKVESYSLQFAEIGLASDYTKKEHNLRLRVEARQYLLHCGSLSNMLRWFLALQMAICLALPLELRTLPEDSRRRRNKLRDRERRERRAQLRQALEAARDEAARCEHAEHDERAPREDGAERAHKTGRSRERHRSVDSKWQPHTRQSRFSEKDFPHLARDATWEGKDVLYRGRWALVSSQAIVYLSTY